MTIDALLHRLEGVRATRRGWQARCPSHKPDTHPSLSVREGERGLLLKCWAGCRLEDICAAIGLRVCELFFDQDADPRQWEAQRRQRELCRAKQARRRHLEGLQIDCYREATRILRAIRTVNRATMDALSPQECDLLLDRIGAAYNTVLVSQEDHEAFSI